MINLVDVTEENWLEIARLSVNDEQQDFLDKPIGIIARGFVDTGYIDDDAPDCLNLMYHFNQET